MRLGVIGLAKQPEPFLTQLLDGLGGHGIRVRPGSTKADVLYLPWTATGVDRPELLEQGVPVVVSCRGAQVNVAPWNPERATLRAGLPKLFERAAAVHCVSDAIRQEATLFGLDPAKATVIRPAVDLQRFTPHPLPGRGHLVSVGRLQWRKGYEYALLAVRRLLDRGVAVTYEIVGEEADGRATRHAVHDLGLADAVTLTPPQGRDEVAGRLAAADVLLLPSLSEGIANAALEAMATARPVVVTDCGGMVEAVTDGVEGRVVPVRDPEATADATADVLAHPGAAAAMGRAGRARVEADHDLDDHVRAFAELFTAVAR
ncbi:MAG TPA: glycosyltransferase family 4 protein [Acidimicrobiales bacterium]|nr:glycosyltransferase family 4 protein [Acidimicrobiales bacterium]